MNWRVGIDIGGTFTDLVALADDGSMLRHKLPSTPQSPEHALLTALRALLDEIAAADVALIAHASTIATNALLGQVHLELPRVAFITTEGFRDVLEIGRQQRSALYDLSVERPRPLALREDRLVVRERRSHDGSVIVELDERTVADAVTVIRERGIRTVAIGLLHADVDGTHERAIADAVRAEIPDADISISSEVDPQYREYERFSTTVVNAALLPIVRAYLERIAEGTRRLGIDAPIFVMRSDGGMSAVAVASRRPAALIESGPASGVIGAAYLARALGIRDVLSFDMGGTTAKAGTIRDGVAQVTNAFEAAGRTHSGRAVKGSGYPVRFPFVDLAEVSAGGGTIASLDTAGSLVVGPISAGADPGPACYALGSDRPTVTDANVVLRRLNPRALLDGAFPIDATLAYRAVSTVAAPLQGDVERAAAGIVALTDAEMAKVLRIVSVERGLDPRTFTLIAFGGGGPLHACAVAAELAIRRVIVPPHPGLFSAYGLLVADIRSVAARSLVAAAGEWAWQRARELVAALTREVDERLAEQGVAERDRRFVEELDVRYLGQSTELVVTAPSTLADAIETFHTAHERRYGFSARTDPVEFVTVRVAGFSATPKPALAELSVPPRAGDAPAILERRDAFDGVAFVATPVYARTALRPGDHLAGPAIIEEYDATTYIARGWTAHLDRYANVVIEHDP